MPKITISYRRDDSLAYTGRLFDYLAAYYGRNAVFMDLESIAPGANFHVTLRQAFAGADVLLVVIGRDWLHSGYEHRGRIFNENDWVRLEIRIALEQNVAIIPVLVDGALMPTPSELPQDIERLSHYQAATLGAATFRADVKRVTRAIDQLLPLRARLRSSWWNLIRPRDSSNITRPPIDLPRPPAVPSLPEVVLPPPTVATPPPIVIPPPSVAPDPIASQPEQATVAEPDLARTAPEYWLRRVEMERKLAPGDAPLVMVSYASEDQSWIAEMRSFLDRRIEQLRDVNGRAYELWNFSDVKRGTIPGDEFPEIVAEKMWRCRVALVVLSKDYFNSQYCRTIELPFLMWRRGNHGLMLLPIKLGALPTDAVRLPAHQHPSRRVLLHDIIDDRQAPENFISSPHRDLSMKQLKERGLESEIENRFDGLSRRVFAYLKTRYDAVEDE